MVLSAIIAGVVASLVWFILGGILYMNPYVSKLYKKEKKNKSVKKWKTEKIKMMEMYSLGVLLPSIIFAFVFLLVQPALPGGLVLQALFFALILVGLVVIPEFLNKKLTTGYPKDLLQLEFINELISVIAISFVFSWLV